VPGRLAELDAPHEHEQVRRQHQRFEDPAEVRLGRFVQKRGQNADADVQIFAIAHHGGEEGDHDHQQDRQWLGPRCGTVEHVTGEHAVRNDQHDDDETCASHE